MRTRHVRHKPDLRKGGAVAVPLAERLDLSTIPIRRRTSLAVALGNAGRTLPPYTSEVGAQPAPLGDEADLAAGDFSSWLGDIQAAIGGDRAADVPCDGCTACCRSSQFIHIGPDESDTLACIPAQLLFPAPRMPEGHVVLGYDERGHCPMLVDNRCSIYEHRPRACRAYDCRVFPAAGIEPDDGQEPVARQARRWRFSFPTQDQRNEYQAVRAAAEFLRRKEGPPVPANPTQLAVLAIEIHQALLGHDEATGQTTVLDPDPETLRREILRRRGPNSTG
jgi:Fe-S-cluster containining protein